MKLTYLKYLKCLCGFDKLSAYQIKDGKSELLMNIYEEVLETGLLVCDNCYRWYPIDEGILYMLPDNLSVSDNGKFIDKYHVVLPSKCKQNGIKVANTEEKSIYHKRNEMETRDKQADIYHTYGDRFHWLNEEKHFIDYLQPSSKDIIIELGCGTGRITEKVISRGFSDYIGIDYSGKSLQLLSNKLDNEVKRKILLVKADICCLPLKSKIADIVLSAQVFEHIPGIKEQQIFIKEVQRVLNINGLAALTIYNYNIRKKLGRIKKGFHVGKIYYEHFTSKEIKGLFDPCFEINRLHGINCYFPMITIFNNKARRFVESILVASNFNAHLGNILFLGLRGRN